MEKKAACGLCGVVMQKRNLNKHYLYRHPDRVECKCEICTSKSTTGSSVKRCDICGMGFCRKMLLAAHKRFVHQLSGNTKYSKYRCKYCSESFTTNRQRYLHLHKNHIKETSKTFVGENQPEEEAKGDGTGGEDNGTTSTHVIHIGEGQGIQYLPKLSEASLSAVIKELMIVSTEKNCKLPYKCLLCGRCFAKTKYIRLHIRRYHVKDEDQPYRCKVCGSGFVRLTEFRKHSRAHSGFRPYKCKVCGKAFKQQANLTDHMNLHNATKAFQCFICKRYFRQRGALNAHIVHHDTLKPFKCTFCDKGFSTRGELSRHMQHYDLGQGRSKMAGVRSFMCHICQESFSHFPLLLKHIDEHHPERPFECQVCNQKFAAFISMYNHKLKEEHFLISEVETEGQGERKVRRRKRSTRDVQEAVFSLEQSSTDIGDGLQDVNESMLIIQSGELYEVPSSGKSLAYHGVEPHSTLVIDQFQQEEVVHGTHVTNENEELLSIAKQLTELSTYTEADTAEADSAAALQEEDEIMKDMLDADHDLLANIGKQLTVAKKDDEWNTDTTMEGFTTNEDLTNSGRVEISQGVDLTVNVGESESGVMAVSSFDSQVVSEASTIKTVPSSMEELASLIAQNSKVTGEAVTAYQTDDGSVIYVCMDQPETVEDVAGTSEYIVASDPTDELKTGYEGQGGVSEEMVLECQVVGMPEANVVPTEDEDTVDNVEGVDDQEGSHLNGQVEADTELVQPVICEASQLEKFTVSDNQVFTSDSQAFTVPQKVIEYIHDEQTFIKEELIDGDYVKIVSTMTNAEDSGAEVEYDSNIYKCSKCNYTNTSRKNIDKHLQRHMPEASRQHVCHICDKRFVTKTELKRHMTTHTGERNYKCNHCNKSFKQPGHLRSHVKSHLGQKDYGCTSCSARFITRTQCRTHWQRQHSTKRFPCAECGKTFGDKMGLKRHQGSIHSGAFPSGKLELEGPHQCHVCGCSFSKRTILKYHMLKHTSEPDLPKFICEVCGDTFRLKCQLTTHVAMQHTDQKPQICEFCGLAFKVKKQLNAHIRLKHSDTTLRKTSLTARRVYICTCGKQFKARHSMAYHIGANEACRNAKVTVEKTNNDEQTKIKSENLI